jgi:hypothetical protein
VIILCALLLTAEPATEDDVILAAILCMAFILFVIGLGATGLKDEIDAKLDKILEKLNEIQRRNL